MNLEQTDVDKFFGFAKERYNIYLVRQQGQKKPWTEDKVLQRYYFCNIFREDDKTTIWVKEHIRDPYATDPDLVFMIAAARLINRIESLTWVYDLFKDVHDHNFWTIFRRQLEMCHPIVTGAYMIRTPTGMSKLDGVIEVLKPIRIKGAQMIKFAQTLEEAHRILMRFEFIGGFMAYEILSDLRHCPPLNEAEDIHTWAHPGPGCTRGMRHLIENGQLVRLTTKDKMSVMQSLLRRSRSQWPEKWPLWEMREVEHTLCEYDKYIRGQNGEPLKRLYHG